MLEVLTWKDGKEEEKGIMTDTSRSASAPGQGGVLLWPIPGARGGGVGPRCGFLLDTYKQSPWERGGLFWTQEDKGLTQTRKEKKQKCSCGTQNTSFELDLIQFHQVNRLGSPRGWAGVEAAQGCGI